MENIQAPAFRIKRYPSEFVFSVVSLMLSVIVIQTYYALVVRPRAEVIAQQDRELARSDPNYEASRSWYVIIKDYEQESCFMLLFWSLALLGYKAAALRRDRLLLDADVLHVPEGMRVLPQDAREYARQIEQLSPEERRLLLPRVMIAALNRFGATHNVQDAASAAREVAESEATRLDSENAMLRYTTWAIPAIGFIGTVRGIGGALSQAHKAVTGDISGVTEGLGTAFNSTLVALLLSLVLMFLLHQLQLAQERLVLDAETYLDNRVLRNLQVR